MNVIRIATRKSPLALWQAEHVAQGLVAAHPGLAVELVTMTTLGDRILDAPLARVGGKGLFVKELEQGMLEGTADIAVHSMKDVPAEFPDGLHLPVVLAREDPHDAFVSNRFDRFEDLPEGAVLGTSSLRRQVQLRALRPDLRVRDLRGNVNTRLTKLDDGDYDAIVLASAGLMRLGMGGRIASRLTTEQCLPAIGQGIIGIECRRGDGDVGALIASLADRDSTLRITAERALNRRLAGGCQVPVAGHAELVGESLRLRGLVGRLDGSEVLRDEVKGPPEDGERLGIELAEALIAAGADVILREVLGEAGGPPAA